MSRKIKGVDLYLHHTYVATIYENAWRRWTCLFYNAEEHAAKCTDWRTEDDAVQAAMNAMRILGCDEITEEE